MIHDNRGQSLQIGAVLLFGALVVAFSMYQATVVPHQNKEVEFNHFSEVKNDMAELRDNILSAGGTGTTQSHSIELGTQYPSRLVALNPPDPGGAIQTEGTGKIEIHSGFDISSLCGYSGKTSSLVYEPYYNELDIQPVAFDSTALYVNGSDDYSVISGQSLINGQTIELTPINTSVRETGQSRESLTFKGGAANGTTKTVNSEFNLTLPTRLPASEWETNDKLFGDVSAVTSVSEAQHQTNAINVTLRADTYTVSCRAIGVGDFPASGAAEPPGVGNGSTTTSPVSTNESDYGKGNTQTYNESGNNTDVIATKGGVLKGIVNVSELHLADPAFAPTRASDGQLQKKSRHLRVGVILQNNSIGTSNYQKYHFIIGDANGIEYDVTKNGIDWKSQEISLVSETDGEQPDELISGGTLKTTALNRWLLDGEELDLLNKSNYDDPPKKLTGLSEVRSFLNNDEEVRLQVVEAHGRVRFEPSE